MHREYFSRFSSFLNKNMEILRFGYYGVPIIILPTSMGRFYDFENNGGLESLKDHINNGVFQLFCVDSTDKDHLYNWEHPIHVSVDNLKSYYLYITKEVFPWLQDEITIPENPVLAGFSLGAFHAFNIGLNVLGITSKQYGSIGIGGKYDFFNFPVSPEAHILSLIKNIKPKNPYSRDTMHIVGCGTKDLLYKHNLQIYDCFTSNSIGVSKLYVEEGGGHDWSTWNKLFCRIINANISSLKQQ